MYKKAIIPSFMLLCIACAAFLICMNNTNITLRHAELKNLLHEMDRSEGTVEHIGLIATFSLHKQLYERRISQDRVDSVEQMIHSLLLQRENNTKHKSPGSGLHTQIFIKLINFNRWILGKSPLRLSSGNRQDMTDIDIAYYYERNFLFSKAIDAYRKAIKRNRYSSAILSSILLHQGYCYALSGQNKKAKNNFHIIIKSYNLESGAITATILLRYIDGFTAERKRVQESRAAPLVKSENLVNLLAYEKALNILEKIEYSADPADISRIKYYKARCFAGLGENEAAVETYLGIITSSPSSRYARLSNRKIYMIGARAGGDNQVQRIAKKINTRLKDPVLTDMIARHTELPAPSQAVPDVRPVKIKKRLLKRIEEFSRTDDTLFRPGRFLVIRTSDGNIFKGKYIEMTDTCICLQTSIGRIDVKRNMITGISGSEE